MINQQENVYGFLKFKVIQKYNNASRIQISYGGESNSIDYAYVYRNWEIEDKIYFCFR
jgi:hypothetical protein